MEFRKNCTYAMATVSSMGVRITPADRQPVHTSRMFEMQATSAESNVLNVASSLGLKTKVLTRFVKDSAIASFIKSELRRRGIDYEGKEKYVLMGASDKYVVGSLDTGHFIKETETLTLCPSSVSYAGQSISGLDGRVVRISWHRLPVKGGRFSQQMSIPYELTLEKGENGFYLKSAPISELLSLRLAPIAEGCAFTGTKAYELSDAAYDIELDCVGGTVSLSVFGNTLEFSSHGKARIIVDRKSIELWYNDYECYEVHYIEYESSSLSITAEDGVNSLSIYPLKDIHE